MTTPVLILIPRRGLTPEEIAQVLTKDPASAITLLAAARKIATGD